MDPDLGDLTEDLILFWQMAHTARESICRPSTLACFKE